MPRNSIEEYYKNEMAKWVKAEKEIGEIRSKVRKDTIARMDSSPENKTHESRRYYSNPAEQEHRKRMDLR
ncbi:MAG: hypothetical protein V1804_02145 [Patescibacteria group bacterium]